MFGYHGDDYTDADRLETMLKRTPLQWHKDPNQRRSDDPESAFIIAVSQPAGDNYPRTLHCVFNFNTHGQLRNLAISE